MNRARTLIAAGGITAAAAVGIGCAPQVGHAALPVNACFTAQPIVNNIKVVDYPTPLDCNPTGNGTLRVRLINNADFDALVGTCHAMGGSAESSYYDTSGISTVLCRVIPQDYADFLAGIAVA